MALDKQETKNSLFGNIKKTLKPPEEVLKSNPEIISTKTDAISNRTQLEIIERVTLPLSIEQKEGLDRLAKKIMRNRSNNPFHKENRERITANTIIRALIDTLLEKEYLFEGVTANNEEEAKRLVKGALKQQS